MGYSEIEKDMARKGYVYHRNSNNGRGMRKIVRNLLGEQRSDLVFDTPAYEQHNAAK